MNRPAKQGRTRENKGEQGRTRGKNLRDVKSLKARGRRANYDSGNSSSLGYVFTEEWDTYGQYVASVHIKDRLKGATTVPLGTGHADFAALARCLKKFNYAGRFILQVARGEKGGEVARVRQNRAFLEQLLLKAA